MERERVIEVFIGLMFIVLVFIMILIGISIGNSKTTSSVVSNSYNKIDNSQNVYYENKETVKIVEKPVQKTHYSSKYSGKTLVKAYNKPHKNSGKTLVKAYNEQGYGKKKLAKAYKNNYYYDYSPKEKHILDWGEDYNYKDYDSYGKHVKEDKSGFYADTYKVYVSNDGPGDYFTVRFYFEDYWGHEKTHDMRKYIGFDNEKVFYFRDICKDKDEYYNWRYKVFT